MLGASIVCKRDTATSEAARAWATTRIADRVDELTVAAVRLIVTELIANAMRYGDGRIELFVIARVDGVRVEVTDEGRDGRVEITDAEPVGFQGRGLRVVDAYAHRWGCDYRPWGKMVWAEIDVDDAGHRRPAHQ